MPYEAADGTNPYEGILPGKPAPYFLEPGEGEKSVVFDTTFNILLSGDETEGQYGAFTTIGPAGEQIPAHFHPNAHEIFYILDGAVHLWMDDQAGFKEDRVLKAGGFGYIPKGTVHAFQMIEASRVFGISTGGFERFFNAMGVPTDDPGIPAQPYITPFPQMLAAGEKYGTVFLPDFKF
jgi:quercetin 2,3-dioxygenase